MGGASSKEKNSGTAVTGKYGKRVEMPAGVIGEQMRGGMRPGRRFCGFTPELLVGLLKEKDASDLYHEFKAEVSQDCGGELRKGWDSAAIQAKVTKFQPRFNDKGIRVTYHMAMWQQYISHGQYGGHMQQMFAYWITYADLEVPIVTADAYDPEQDYGKDGSVATAAGSPITAVAGKPEFDPVGHWTLDVGSQTPSAALTEGEMTISRGDDKALRTVGTAQAKILCFSKTIAWDEPLEHSGGNVFGCSTADATIEVAMTSADTMMTTSASRNGTFQMVYRKV